MDLYLADRVAAPPELSPDFSEKLLLLPFTLLSTDHRNMYPSPPVSGSGGPGNKGGELAASFNRLVKIDRETCQAWVR